MTWAKIDDQLAFHPKAVQAGNEALGMWVRAMSYSCQMLTGGFIAKDMAVAFGGVKVAKRLVNARLWHEVDGGYQFHDWDQYQPCAETEKAKREATRVARSEAGKAGAGARWNGKNKPESMANDMAKPMANGMAKGMAKPMANGWQNDAPEPEPDNLSNIVVKPTRKTQLQPGWKPSPAGYDYAKTKAPGMNIEASLEDFEDYNLRNNRTNADWDAAWRTWVRKAVEFNALLAQPLPPPKKQFTGYEDDDDV
jgi:hypothetical protein